MANADVTLVQVRDGTGDYKKGSGVSLGVMAIQKALHMYGYNLNGSADGIFGSNTEAIVKGFQDEMGIPVTGVVNAETLAKLEAWSGTLYETPTETPALRAVEYGLDILHTGDSGAAVYSVQSLLTRHGYTCQTTGSYTSTVASLVKQFQSKNGLAATGNVTQGTLAVLQDLTSATAWMNGSTVKLTAGKLAKAEFDQIILRPDIVAQLNKALNTYGVTTRRKVRHFLAQSMAETQKGTEIMEDKYYPGNVSQYGGYWGTGVLQMTHEMQYVKFYDHMKALGIDDSKIKTPAGYATQHVALHYPATSAGWIWERAKLINDMPEWNVSNPSAAEERQLVEELTRRIKGGGATTADFNERYRYYEIMLEKLPG